MNKNLEVQLTKNVGKPHSDSQQIIQMIHIGDSLVALVTYDFG